ncbi:MAG TPA: inositol monophosphatase family protein [Nitrososphaeraceae archaeon]|jgi:myo-inositol-1(or 4)-monophosphatase|nr:inositol monophosphatase family protein [Nitrososphaeraceae archaeon]
MVMIIDILKEACYEVYQNTRNVIGTVEGNEKFGRGAGGDISRKIDLDAEKSVRDTLNRHNFNPTIIGEECGIIQGKDGFLIMDAMDGTMNASRGIPFCCCSLAYSIDFRLSSVVDAAVIDLSVGDLYYASKEKGAYWNGDRIYAGRSKTRNNNSISEQNIQDIIVGMNISGISEDTFNRLSSVISKSLHIRHFGANALELCYFARGLMDAYIDFRGKIRVTDMAAAYLIVKEAGAKIYSDNGSELESELGVNKTMSFMAVIGDEMYKMLSEDLKINT